MRRAELLPLAAMLVASPALAQEARHSVSVAGGRLDAAVVALGQQTGASIGIRDGSIGGVRVHGVRGRYSVEAALARMLRGTDVRVRRVAAGAWLIERAPARPERQVARAAARPLRPPETVGTVDQEILVTGTKRDVPLGVYPGGVQILDGEGVSLADAARGTEAIAVRTASLASTHLGPGRNKLFIRGIADSSFVGPTQATVGQYWGNSRITYSAPDPDLRLYDIGRVEVLEGPQGTLYGAGSLGGVVRVMPRAPDLWRQTGSVWAGGQLVEHGDPGGDVGALVNLPIREGSLAFRGLAYAGVDGGYIDDRQRGLSDVNRVRTFGGRAALRWEVDGWRFDLSGVGQRILGDDAQYADRGGDGLSRASAIAQPFSNAFWLAELMARKSWGDVELTTATAIARQHVSETYEGLALVADPAEPFPLPSVGGPPAAYEQRNRVTMLTSETRLARRGPDGTGWLVGLSLLRNRARVNRSFDMRRSVLTGVRNTVEEATLYGEGTVRLAPGVTLTGGGRLTHSRLTGKAEDVDQILAFRQDPNARAARSETRFLPSAALAWRPFAGLTLFGRYEQGFRPGGLAVRQNYIQRFDGDRLSTLESGVRYGGPGFDLTASASWTWWSSIQADLIDGLGFPVTANIGDGRVVSVGVAARWKPVPGLDLDAALYLNGSKVTDPDTVTLPVFATGGGTTVDTEFNASRLPNVADASGRIGASYQTRIGEDALFAASGYARYVGRSTLGIGPILGQVQGDYVDTGLELRVERGGRALTLSATNLLDTRGNRFALGTPFLIGQRNQITPLRPRAVRLGLEIAF